MPSGVAAKFAFEVVAGRRSDADHAEQYVFERRELRVGHAEGGCEDRQAAGVINADDLPGQHAGAPEHLRQRRESDLNLTLRHVLWSGLWLGHGGSVSWRGRPG